MGESLLSKATTKNKQRGRCTVLYGVGGIGKTTFGAEVCKNKKGIMIQSEEGLSSLGMTDIPRVEVDSWPTFQKVLGELIKEKHDYECVVIDTLDALMPSMDEHIVNTYYDGNSKAANAYMAKYSEYTKEFNRVLGAFNILMSRNISVICLVHSTISDFKDPHNEEFKRWQLKLPTANKMSIADNLYDFCDNCLFANFEVTVSEGKPVGSKRFVYSEWSPTAEAKSRLGMPKKILLDYEELSCYI